MIGPSGTLPLRFLLVTRSGGSGKCSGVGLEALLPLLEHISGVDGSLGNQRLGLLLGTQTEAESADFPTPQM